MAVDLNQVRTLVLLYETRSLTACAERLHVTQPTVSYTLGRLRRRFGDDLFRRDGRVLTPTPLATQLYGPLSRGLAQIDGVLTNPGEFDPSAHTHELAIALSSLGEVTFLSAIVDALHRQAPAARLKVTPVDVGTLEEALLRGTIDLAVSVHVLQTDLLWRTPFMDVEYVAITSREHPLGEGEQALRARRFVEVTQPTSHFYPRQALYQHGLGSNIGLVIEGYAAVPYAVESSDLVAVVPRHVAEFFQRTHRLLLQQLPWPVSNTPVALYSRHVANLSPAQAWFRTVVLDAVTKPNETEREGTSR